MRRALAIAGALGAMLIAASAQAQNIELKVSVFAPPSNPMPIALEEWGKHLKEKSNGRLTIKMFAASQMGPPPRQFDLARTGVADIAVVGYFFTPGRFPLIDLTSLPGMLTSSGYASSLAFSQIANQALAAEHPGVKIICIGVITPTLIISKSPIKTVADLKGRRIRSAGAQHAEMLAGLGAVPTQMQPGEMNDGLAKGMIDGAGTAYSGIASFQLVDVAKSITEGAFGSVTFGTVMNQAAYDKLPADLKKIFDESLSTAAHLMGRHLSDDETKHRQASIAKGATIIPLSDDGTLAAVSAKLRDKAIADATAKGLDAKGFLTKLAAAVAPHKDKK